MNSSRLKISTPAAAMMLLLHGVVSAADLLVTPTEAPLANLVRVVVPDAKGAAVSDMASLLVFANASRADAKIGSLAVFGLDAQGNPVGTPAPVPPAPPVAAPVAGAPAATPVPPPPPLPPIPLFTVELPRAASLATFPNAAQYLLFHPKLPLLYVWQDIAGPPMASAKDNVVFKEFDHLLIYSLVAGQPPKLELATARGPGFMYGQLGAMLALDPACKRLFLPNLRALNSADNAMGGAVGYLKLDDRGLPVKEGEQLAMTVENLPIFNEIPAGMGCVFVSDSMSIFGGARGPTTWDAANRRAKFNACFVGEASIGYQRLVGHPTLPVVYVACLAAPVAYWFEHVDGYLTMQPQRLEFKGSTILTPPVLVAKQTKLAFGGAGKVIVVGLDATGRFAAPITQTTVNNPATAALAYSDKFDKLYVAVQTTP